MDRMNSNKNTPFKSCNIFIFSQIWDLVERCTWPGLDTVLEKLNGGWWGNEEKRKLKRFFFWVQSSAITNLWEKKSCRKERGESFRRALFKTCAHEIMQTCKYFVQTSLWLEYAPYPELSSSNIAVCASFSKCPAINNGCLGWSTLIHIENHSMHWIIFFSLLITVQEHNSDMIIHDLQRWLWLW